MRLEDVEYEVTINPDSLEEELMIDLGDDALYLTEEEIVFFLSLLGTHVSNT